MQGTIFASICLSDIPKDKIKQGSNGKLYLAVEIKAKKETDQFGNNVFIALNPSKEEREAAKAVVDAGGEWPKSVFLGDGKHFMPRSNENAAEMPYSNGIPDDLPF